MAAYEATIRIGVQGQQELDAAITKIERLQKATSGEARFSKLFDQGVLQSLDNYNQALRKASNLLSSVGAGTKLEAAAVQQYVSALGQANTARARQNALIAEQIRFQRLAASGIRETSNQYARPAGPAGNAADLAAGTFRAGTAKVTEATKIAEQAGDRLYVLELKRIEDAATAGIAADNEVFQQRIASEEAYWNRRLKLAAQARQVEARDATRAGLDTSGRGRRRELDRTGGLSFDERLAQAQERRAQTTARQNRFRPQFTGNRTQAIQGAAIGGGFPLLFGQGAGASVGGLLGGGLGGALTGSGAFAGGIVGSLIGTQFDKLKASALGLADALKAPSEALAAMEASGIKVSGALKNTVDALESTGRAAEAQALVFAELERLGGTSYVQNLLELEEANKALQEEWSKLSVQVQNELLPAFITLTETFTALAKVLRESQIVDIITRVASIINGIPRVGAELLQGKGLGQALAIGGNQVASAFGQDQRTQQQRQPGPVDDTRQRKALDEAIARQKEVLDLQRRGEDLIRAGIDFRRDQEDQIYNLRRKAADYDREVARFRRDIEDKIADKQEENARTLAELTRQRRQNVIEQLDQTLEPAGQVPALEGGGRAASVDLAREYIRTIAEGQADLQEKETKSKLDIAKVQRDADRFSLDVADKVKDFSDKAADYAKEVEKFKYETAKKVVDLQRQAADYTYAQWERVYKLAATAAERSAAAAQNPQGDVSIGQVGASGASIAKTLADALKLTPAQAAGIVGNLQRESGLNPRINEGGAVGLPRGVGGYGLAQWTGGRQTDLIRFAGGASQAGDLRTQVRFIISELLGPEANALRQLRRTGSPEEAAVNFDRFYERSGIKALGERQANARAVYNQIAKGGAASLPATNTLAAAAPVNFPSARSVAGPAPKAPSALPLTGVPSSLVRPDVSGLVGQYKDLNAESVRYLQDLQQTAREAVKLNEAAAKTKLGRGLEAIGQQFLQPLLDANQALEDRAAYEREYGDLLKNGALPALAEQLATADQLEKTQLRLLEIEQKAYELSIQRTKELIAKGDLSAAELDQQTKILAVLEDKAAILDNTRTGIIQQSDQQRGQIQAAESPEARRQRAINRYTERANERNDPNRRFETFLEAKSNLEDLTDPTNQIISAANGIGDAFGNAFKDVATGSKTAQEALSDMFTNIGASFIDMAAKILAQQAVFSIMQAFGFGGGGGLGGLLGGGGGAFSATGGGLFNTAFSFAGGGYTGDGARLGGVDGQGGFPAILHPQETVVDHTRPSSAVLDTFQGGGGSSSDEPIRVETTTINSVEYATVGQVRQASAAAAKQGEARALNRLYSSTSARKRLGM